MTRDILYLLVRASLTASLSDREAFIKRVSKVIERYTDTDPDAAKHISNYITGAMEGVNSGLLLNNLFNSRQDKKLNKTLDELTVALEKLNTLLEEAGLPNTTPKPDNQ